MYKKPVDVDLLTKAESAILRNIQRKSFGKDIVNFPKSEESRQKKTALHKFSPFLDSDGIVRVGGRLVNSELDWHLKHPILIPKSHVATLLIRSSHEKVQHGGRDATLNDLRQRGYMIINANSRVRNEIYKCVVCRRIRGKFGEQRMADLPSERCSEAAPFTYAGVDMFGPFLIKEGRKELKRYGVLFTCFANRAIHLESTFGY